MIHHLPTQTGSVTIKQMKQVKFVQMEFNSPHAKLNIELDGEDFIALTREMLLVCKKIRGIKDE